MTHPAVAAYWVPRHLPDAAGLASLAGDSRRTMATPQAVVEAPDSLRELLARIVARDGDLPQHSHNKEEHMVILDGELPLGSHLMRQGEVHIAPPGSWHPAITTERSALLLRCEYPFPVG